METPRPFSLLCELTYRCPLQCPYCSNPLDFARHTTELTTDEWKRVLSEAAALGVVQSHFSGGEPLLRKDVVEIIGHAHELGLYTNLSTGGTLLNDTLTEQLRAAGLDSLQVSLQDSDAVNSDRLAGGPPSFEKKIRAARLAKQAGFPLTLNFVLHRQNIGHLAAIIALAEELGAERLELANTQFNGWALKNRVALLPTRAQVETGAEIVRATQKRLKGQMEILHVLPDYFEQFPKPCLHGWGRVFMTVAADGLVLPCQTAREIRGMKFDNIRGGSLERIWFQSEAFCKFRGTDWLPEPCQSCPRKEMDFGGCRCQAFLLAGDAAVTDPVCSLSPHHEVITRALAEAESAGTEQMIYRNPGESLKSMAENV
ncbi:MAG TPA: pyrroloquinoline quinone biosynthesis protein PqqE [Candidatus Acidoferrum sp.]|jgi:pyrroloquinoline quinone biosynthesis protein E|nr:pyrroloquinoline quinone biosynthesis protein PqqE [Candidatus Acidoferrum sp.]